MPLAPLAHSIYNWDRPHEALGGLSPIDRVCKHADKTPLWDEVYCAYDAMKGLSALATTSLILRYEC